jgi:hypothetical protein
MAIPSNPFRPNPAGATNGQIIRAIVYMLDIMPYFFLKQGSKAAKFISEMNNFSAPEETLMNYFFATGIQLRPAGRLEGNNVTDLTANQILFETR